MTASVQANFFDEVKAFFNEALTISDEEVKYYANKGKAAGSMPSFTQAGTYYDGKPPRMTYKHPRSWYYSNPTQKKITFSKRLYGISAGESAVETTEQNLHGGD